MGAISGMHSESTTGSSGPLRVHLVCSGELRRVDMTSINLNLYFSVESWTTMSGILGYTISCSGSTLLSYQIISNYSYEIDQTACHNSFSVSLVHRASKMGGTWLAIYVFYVVAQAYIEVLPRNFAGHATCSPLTATSFLLIKVNNRNFVAM